MEAEIFDIESIRQKRADQRRAEAEVFGRLPCPCCDRMTSASEVVSGFARYVCDGGGSHAATAWSGDNLGTVSDHNNRIRKFYGY
ncbi:hypothetical protein D3C71_382540 [compost metagenome]